MLLSGVRISSPWSRRQSKRKPGPRFVKMGGKQTTAEVAHMWTIQAGRALRFEYFASPDHARFVFDAMCREAAASGVPPGVGALGPTGVPVAQGGQSVGGALVGDDIGNLFG